jgi:hypothetical protein
VTLRQDRDRFRDELKDKEVPHASRGSPQLRVRKLEASVHEKDLLNSDVCSLSLLPFVDLTCSPSSPSWFQPPYCLRPFSLLLLVWA